MLAATRTVTSGQKIPKYPDRPRRLRYALCDEPWDVRQGQRHGPFQVFRSDEQRHELEQNLRGLVLRPRATRAVAEAALTYQVVPGP